MYADLHLHTCYSDGTMTPAELVAAAKDNNVTLLAVADHNTLEGYRQTKPLCEKENIRCFAAVELDCKHNGEYHHVLAYGFQPDHREFNEFIRRNRALLDSVNTALIQKMGKEVPCVSMQEYDSFTYDRRKGGWKVLHYLIGKGLAATFGEVLAYYDQYECPATIADFPSVRATCRMIGIAGGRCVLAHPGKMIEVDTIGEFERRLRELTELGLDGIECYYPSHSQEVTDVCVRLCRERNLLITSGSDCHGGFGRTTVGQMKITPDKLQLNGLAIE